MRKLGSQLSPETAAILRPSSAKNKIVDSFKGPSVSFDQLPVQLQHHLSKLLDSHRSQPVCVWATVMSQVKGFLCSHAISLKPSGRLPSCLANPTGFFVTGTPADTTAHAMTSFRAWCLAIWGGAFLQMKACKPLALTSVPQPHVCETQTLLPSHRRTATWTDSSSRQRLHNVMGRA